MYKQVGEGKVVKITNWRNRTLDMATFDVRMVRNWNKYIYLYLIPSGAMKAQI